MAIPPKIGGTLFEVICAAGALRASISIFSRLAQPPVVGVCATTNEDLRRWYVGIWYILRLPLLFGAGV